MHSDPVPSEARVDGSVVIAEMTQALGFGLFYAWTFLGLFGRVFYSTSTYSAGFEHLLRLLALVCYSGMLFGFRRYAAGLLSKRARPWILAICGVLALLAPAATVADMMGVHVHPVVGGIVWLCFGVTSAAFFLLWGAAYCSLRREHAMRVTAFAFGMGGLLFLVASYLQPPGNLMATVLTLILSIALYAAQARVTPERSPIDIPLSRAHLDLSTKTAFAVTFDGIAFGFMLSLAVTQSGTTQPALVIGSATLTAGMLFTALVKPDGSRIIAFGTMQRIALPILVAGLMFIPFVGPTGKLICAFVLLNVFGCYDVSNWGTLAVLGGRYEVQPAYHWSRGRSSLMLGLTIGWGLGYVLAYVFSAEPIAMAAGSLGVALLLAVAVTIVPHGSDHLIMLKVSGEHAGHDDTHPGMGPWKRRCLHVAEHGGLTPREQEVMFLLAKGRNAAHIERDLVISGHTAKTHIYRIYRKLGVKTQQELIDLVEEGVGTEE